MRETTIPNIFAHYEPVLATPEGQSAVVRALVHSIIRSFFGNDDPLWHCQALFQVLRKESDLRDFIVREVLTPLKMIEKSLFRAIHPDMTSMEADLHFLILTAPVCFHADYMDVILGILEVERYPEEYLRKMEEILVRQTLRYFGLPEATNEGSERE